MNSQSNGMDARVWLMLVVLASIWGASFLFGRVAVQEMSPLTLVFFRVALAAIALNIYLAVRRGFLFGTMRDWRDFAVMGVLNNIVPFTLIFYGQQEIGAGLAAIVNAMTPIWTALIGHVATADERLSANKIAGITLGFAGVATLVGSAALAGLQASAWAQLAVLGATMSYGVAGVFGRRFSTVPAVQTARGQLTASTVILLVALPVAGAALPQAMPSAAALWSIFLLALLCTAYAYILFFRILASAGAVNVSLVTLLVPISAIVLGIVLLGETLELRHAIGLLIILAGLVCIDGRIPDRLKRRVGRV